MTLRHQSSPFLPPGTDFKGNGINNGLWPRLGNEPGNRDPRQKSDSCMAVLVRMEILKPRFANLAARSAVYLSPPPGNGGKAGQVNKICFCGINVEELIYNREKTLLQIANDS